LRGVKRDAGRILRGLRSGSGAGVSERLPVPVGARGRLYCAPLRPPFGPELKPFWVCADELGNARMKATSSKALRGGSRTPLPNRQPRRTNDLALTLLKKRLLRRLLADSANPQLRAGLQQAAAEAESL